MKKKMLRGFDEYLDESLRKNPALAKEYFRQLAELPLPTQLAILRTHQGFSQSEVAKTLRVKQPHVARAERVGHDSKLSSIEAQARAIHCQLVLVPDKYVSMVREKIDFTDVELDKVAKRGKAHGGKSFKSGRVTKRMRGFLEGIDTAVKRGKDRL
jgi:transcriptional regulator with XRE-family HTH domain